MAPISCALTLTALGGLPEIAPGDDLASIMVGHSRALLRPGDHAVALIAQKVVSKAEGRTVALRDVQPGAAARELAVRVDKDPRLIELILAESTAVIRTRPGVLIVEHHSGHILANAGIDTSNIVQRPGDPQVLLWPQDPDGSARQLALALSAALGRDIPVIVTDSMGRAWRNGVVGHAIGCYGLRPLWDRVGERDRCGNRLRVTQVASTLGDKPERRYRLARAWLRERGYTTTIDYVAAAAAAVLRQTGLIPHINAGTLSRAELRRLRRCSASMGIMLESASAALLAPGGAHHGSPDKRPWRRLATLVRAGCERVPMTTGLLIGIGETRRDRVQDLFTIRRLHERYGHIQEVIVQNFRAKPGTPMAARAEPDNEELCWTIAMARLILGPDMSVQAPPNLSPGALAPLIAAGVNDWGGISPLTPDHVNPEAPWPTLRELSRQSQAVGKRLLARLTVYPPYLHASDEWLCAETRKHCLARVDSEGLLRDSPWQAGQGAAAALPGADALPVDPGLRSTATMMFGHVDTPQDWAEHLLALRRLQCDTGGFTEFVPLPFVAAEAPMARRGRSRHGPTLREAILVHAVARIALGRDIPNIQTSWVKMGRRHALDCLAAGANDLGGTLMNESITRAAGAVHGQCWAARDLRQAIEARGRAWRLRRTDYRDAPPERVARALAADAAPSRPINHPAGRWARGKAFGGGIAEITLDCEAPGK